MQASKIGFGRLFKVLVCVLLLLASVGVCSIANGLSGARTSMSVASPSLGVIPTTMWVDQYDFTGYDFVAVDESLATGQAGSYENPYAIRNPKDLTFLSVASRVATNASFAGVFFRQVGNIDLSANKWTPIGSSAYRFAGTYDGDENNIIGMCISEQRGTYLGLFSYLSGATMIDIVFDDGYVSTDVVGTSREAYVGMLAGHAQNTEFVRIKTDGSVSAPANYIGGIVGAAVINGTNPTLRTFEDCENGATVTGEYRTGGLTGSSLGYNFTGCTNEAVVTSNAYSTSTVIGVAVSSCVGGLVGYIEGNDPITIENCHNNNEVIARGINRDAATENKKIAANYAGGLVGYSVSTRVIISFIDCTNEGAVTASGSYVGGLGGRVDFITVTRCANTAPITAGVKYSENPATIAPTHIGGTDVGGLFGYISRGNIEDSSNAKSGEIFSTGYYVGGIVGSVRNTTTIENTHNYADVRAESYYDAGRGVGGIAGYWTSGISRSYIIDCSNGFDLDDGFLNTTTITGSSAGGVIGYSNNSNITITNFFNYGAVEAKAFSYIVDADASPPTVVDQEKLGNAGGFIGYAGTAGGTILIQGNSKLDTSNNFGKLQGVNIGGAIAYANSTNTLTIRNFKNKADIVNVAFSAGIPDLGDATNIKTSNLGGIVGYNAARTTLTDVTNDGDIITLTAPSGSNSFTGGIAGRFVSPDTTLTDVVNNNTVWVINANVPGHYVGGIAGESRGIYLRVNNYGDVKSGGYYIGGLVGYFYGTSIKNSNNYADHVDGVQYINDGTSTHSAYIGGLIGITGAGTTLVMEECNNYAEVSGGPIIGGIIGRSSQTLTMRSVINKSSATVNSTSYYAGGLIGQQSAGNLKIYNSANEAAVTSTLKTTTRQYAAGGLIGSSTAVGARLYIENSENSGDITAMCAGGIIGSNYIGNAANAEFYKVTNTGDVTSPGYKSGASTYVGGYAGGIMGDYAGSYGALLLRDVVNSGDITGRYVGGIAGRIHTLEAYNTVNSGVLSCNFVASNPELDGLPATNTGSIGGIAYNVTNFAKLDKVTNSAGTFNLQSTMQYLGGLIALCKNAEISNSVNLANILAGTFNVTAIGGLIGFASESTILQINASHSSGNISGQPITNSHGFGGLVGTVYNQIGYGATNGVLEIKNSYVECSVTGLIAASADHSRGIGGLVGVVRGAYNITNNMVYATLTARNSVGGIIGYHLASMDISDDLPYTIKNCYVQGTFNGAKHNSTSSAGGFIGYINFANALTTANKPAKIDINIIDSLSVMEFSNDFDLNGGLVGRVTFNTHATLASLQYLNFTRAFYLYDVSEGINVAVSNALASPASTDFAAITSNAYATFAYGGATPTKVSITTGAISTDVTTQYARTQLTEANAKLRTTYDGWDFSGESSGADKTFWAIAEGVSTFNNNFPFLRNTFNGTIIFKANGGEFEVGTLPYSDTFRFGNTFVGNEVTLNENVAPIPVRPYYEFRGWQDENGKTYEVGSLVEVIDAEMILTAIWANERYYLSFANGGTLMQGTGVADEMYIAVGMAGLSIESTDPGTFVRWEVRNSAGAYVEIFNTDTVALNDTIIGNLITNYSFIEDGVKVIRLLQIMSGDKQIVSVNFANNGTSLDNATVRIKEGSGDYQAYKIGDILSIESATVITLEINPKAHYDFDTVALTNGAAGAVSYTDLGDNRFEITVAGRLDIQVHLVKKEYAVILTQNLNSTTGAIIDDVALLSGFTSGTNVTIDATDLNSIIVVTDMPGYRFVGLFAKNSSGAFQSYTPAKVTANFLNNYVSLDGNIYIVAVFMKQYKLTINPQIGSTGDGEAVPYTRGAGGINPRVGLDEDSNSAYIDVGTTIILEMLADPRSMFGGITINGGASTMSTTVVMDGDKDIRVQFNLAYYSVVLQTIDNTNVAIDSLSDNIEIFTTAENLDSIIVGTTISILALTSSNPTNYQFDGWYVNVDGVPYPLSVLGSFTMDPNNFTVSDLTLTASALGLYTNINSQLVIVAKFNQLYTVSASVSDTRMGEYTLYAVNGDVETEYPAPYQCVAGTNIKIVANVKAGKSDYYKFVRFEGVEPGFVVNGNEVTFVVGDDASIRAMFTQEILSFALDTNTDGARGNVTTTATTIAIDDEIIINFNISAGFEATGWKFIDKYGVKHDASDLAGNIQYTESSSVLRLKVDEYWLENFGTTFKSEVTTMMNSTYFMALLIGGISIPILLAGILLYIILNNKKKAAAAVAAERGKRTQFGLQTDYVQKIKSGEAQAGRDSLKDKQ